MNSQPAEIQSCEQILNSAAIIIVNHSEETNPWIRSLKQAWVKEIQSNSTDTLIKETAQKIAIVINETDPDSIQRVIDEYESMLGGDPSISLRYIYLFDGSIQKWPDIENPKFRAIDYMSIAPGDFAKWINRTLNKARLPEFLRIGYHIEISDTELVEINGNTYRKITIKTYLKEHLEKKLRREENHLAHMKRTVQKPIWREKEFHIRAMKREFNDTPADEIEYTTTHLYIHNKELYEIKDDKIRKIDGEKKEIQGNWGPKRLEVDCVHVNKKGCDWLIWITLLENSQTVE